MEGKRLAMYRLLQPVLVCLAVICCLPGPACASEPVLDETLPSPALERTRRPFSPFEPIQDLDEPLTPKPPEDACDWDIHDDAWQEASEEVLRGMACHSFRWFDSLFGDSEDFPEEEVNGLLTFGSRYTQYDGLEPRMRLRVRAPLPNLDKRWDILLGRVDEDDYITDRQTGDRTFYNPGQIKRNEEPSWLLGLGHRRKGQKQGWDWSAGIRLRTPPVPFVRTQWFYAKSFTEQTDLRFRQTFFWRDDDGFGTTSRGDLAHAINARDVLRWESVLTVSDATEDLEWYAGQTWYHLLDNDSAYSLLAFVRGETGAEVPLQEYGFNLIWRRPFTRDWMYLSIGPSVTWPRYELHEKREMSLGFGVWIEMEFGEWQYR
jgi:hypothetical protein